MDLKHKLILLATILASGMAFLDGTVVNVAIPTIQSELKTDVAGIQWVVNAYVLMLASFILISGALGDRFGRRKIFGLGIVIFAISSLLCSLSNNISQLIASRTLQGLGASMMIPGSLSIIHSCFEEKYQGRAIGIWSGLAGGVAAIGPFIGGFLVENFSWQSIFFINIPIGILAIFLTIRFIPESKNEGARGLDLLGAFLTILGLFGIAFGLIYGPMKGWQSLEVIGSLILGILGLVGFVFVEKIQKYPSVPLHIFNSPLIIGANLITLALYFALNGVVFYFILNLQQIQNYSPIQAGMSLLPPILLITFLSSYGGIIADKIGPRLPLIAGPLIVGFGMGFLSLSGTGANYFRDYLPGLLLFGGGMSLVVAPVTKSALAVNAKYSGAASGVNNAIARVAALLAVALLGAIMLTLFKNNLHSKIETSSLLSSQKQTILTQQDRFAGIELGNGFDEQSRQEASLIIKDSFIYSFRIAMGICAAFAFLSAFISYLTIKKNR